jgi:hypothetical protein
MELIAVTNVESECTELYIHRAGEDRVSLRAVDPGEKLATVASVGPDDHLWLEDVDEEIDANQSVRGAGLTHRGHLHVSRCRQVTVQVSYNGAAKDHRFRPAARIERVFDWAVSKRGFGLTPTDAAEHVLQITGTNVQPDLADHIGSFVDKRCVVSLSLVPKIRNEG